MPIRSQFETEAEWLDHLRSWFAGQALAGMGAWTPGLYEPLHERDRRERKALWAYAMADAMLEARNVKAVSEGVG